MNPPTCIYMIDNKLFCNSISSVDDSRYCEKHVKKYILELKHNINLSKLFLEKAEKEYFKIYNKDCSRRWDHFITSYNSSFKHEEYVSYDIECNKRCSSPIIITQQDYDELIERIQLLEEIILTKSKKYNQTVPFN